MMPGNAFLSCRLGATESQTASELRLWVLYRRRTALPTAGFPAARWMQDRLFGPLRGDCTGGAVEVSAEPAHVSGRQVCPLRPYQRQFHDHPPCVSQRGLLKPKLLLGWGETGAL